MRKKEYIQPEVKEIKLILPTILTGSEEVSTETITGSSDIASLNADFDEFEVEE